LRELPDDFTAAFTSFSEAPAFWHHNDLVFLSAGNFRAVLSAFGHADVREAPNGRRAQGRSMTTGHVSAPGDPN
jgi:hypothetical protein